jgi:hypothetical protein
MKLEIYGLSKEDLSGSWGEKLGEYLGVYDGVEFKSDKYKIEELEEFEYLHIFIEGKLKAHSPKRFNKNIGEKLQKMYIREFGETIQISLF